jgi:hypothetical protein
MPAARLGGAVTSYNGTGLFRQRQRIVFTDDAGRTLARPVHQPRGDLIAKRARRQPMQARPVGDITQPGIKAHAA